MSVNLKYLNMKKILNQKKIENIYRNLRKNMMTFIKIEYVRERKNIYLFLKIYSMNLNQKIQKIKNFINLSKI